MKVTRPPRLSECYDPTATYLAGGTDLMVAINFGRERPEHVMALRDVKELAELEVGERVRVGGGVTYTRLVAALGDRSPAMVQAARTIGSPQIRNAATLGGNVGTCSPAGDTLPVLAALDADIVLSGADGERRLKLAEYMTGPKRSVRRPGEVVLAVEWDDHPGGQAFLKAGTRNAMVIAVASLAVVVDRAARVVRAAVGSAGPTIIRAEDAERHAAGLFERSGWDRPLAAEGGDLRRFGELVAQAARPIDDVRGTAAYRRHVVGVMAERALARAGGVA